jgi:hypothetical protein
MFCLEPEQLITEPVPINMINPNGKITLTGKLILIISPFDFDCLHSSKITPPAASTWIVHPVTDQLLSLFHVTILLLLPVILKCFMFRRHPRLPPAFTLLSVDMEALPCRTKGTMKYISRPFSTCSLPGDPLNTEAWNQDALLKVVSRYLFGIKIYADKFSWSSNNPDFPANTQVWWSSACASASWGGTHDQDHAADDDPGGPGTGRFPVGHA